MFENVVLENFLKIHFFLFVRQNAGNRNFATLLHLLSSCCSLSLWGGGDGVSNSDHVSEVMDEADEKMSGVHTVTQEAGFQRNSQNSSFGWKPFPLSDLAAWLHVCRVNPGQCDSCGVCSSLLFSSQPPSPLSICDRDVSINQSV